MQGSNFGTRGLAVVRIAALPGSGLSKPTTAVIDTAPCGERSCGIRDAALRCFVSAI